MCESFRPGMTVRPPQSITFVAGPRSRRISSLRPTAQIFPSLMATASTNDGTPLVAILALWTMLSGCMRGSLLTFRKDTPLKPLFACSSRRRYYVLGGLCWRGAVGHCVRVLDTYSVFAVVSLHDVHDGVVGVCFRPIALP